MTSCPRPIRHSPSSATWPENDGCNRNTPPPYQDVMMQALARPGRARAESPPRRRSPKCWSRDTPIIWRFIVRHRSVCARTSRSVVRRQPIGSGARAFCCRPRTTEAASKSTPTPLSKPKSGSECAPLAKCVAWPGRASASGSWLLLSRLNPAGSCSLMKT